MSRIKKAIRNIPPKQPGEEPATADQLGYLRSFGFFAENTIKDLGIWQATRLIDAAVDIRENGEFDPDTDRITGKPQRGIGRMVCILLAGGIILWIAASLNHGDPTESTSDGDQGGSVQTTSEGKSPPARLETAKIGTAAGNDPVAEAFGTKSIKRDRGLILAEIELPVSVVTVEPVSLLDKTGKETSIPSGTKIKITSRSKGGTLTIEIDGVLFVGNESRLTNKIKSQ